MGKYFKLKDKALTFGYLQVDLAYNFVNSKSVLNTDFWFFQLNSIPLHFHFYCIYIYFFILHTSNHVWTRIQISFFLVQRVVLSYKILDINRLSFAYNNKIISQFYYTVLAAKAGNHCYPHMNDGFGINVPTFILQLRKNSRRIEPSWKAAMLLSSPHQWLILFMFWQLKTIT